MLLYIIRHAHAGQHGDPRYPDDSLRPLTRKGMKQFRRVAKKLVKRGVAPTLVATSPLVRCRQTAEVLVDRLDVDAKLIELSALSPGSDLEALVKWSNEQAVDEFAWVGHAPDLDKLTGALIGGQESSIQLAKGAAAAIAFDNKIALGEGRLQWCVTPEILGV